MKYLIGLLAGIVLIALGLWPVKAQSCASVESVVADIVESGGYVVDLIDVESDHLTQLLVFVAKGTEKDALIIGGVKDGCMVGGPIALDTVERGTPA